jgi:hypothetical protein
LFRRTKKNLKVKVKKIQDNEKLKHLIQNQNREEFSDNNKINLLAKLTDNV